MNETKTLATKSAVNTTSSIDDAMLELSLLKKTVAKITAKYTSQIDELRLALEEATTPLREKADQIEASILRTAAKEWDRTSIRQQYPLGDVKWSLPKGRLDFTFNEATTLKLIEKAGLADRLIKTTKSVKKNEVKELPEKQLIKLGCEIVKDDPTPALELNYEMIMARME